MSSRADIARRKEASSSGRDTSLVALMADGVVKVSSGVRTPPTRWSDDLVRVAGTRWMRMVQDQSVWPTLRE